MSSECINRLNFELPAKILFGGFSFAFAFSVLTPESDLSLRLSMASQGKQRKIDAARVTEASKDMYAVLIRLSLA